VGRRRLSATSADATRTPTSHCCGAAKTFDLGHSPTSPADPRPHQCCRGRCPLIQPAGHAAFRLRTRSTTATRTRGCGCVASPCPGVGRRTRTADSDTVSLQCGFSDALSDGRTARIPGHHQHHCKYTLPYLPWKTIYRLALRPYLTLPSHMGMTFHRLALRPLTGPMHIPELTVRLQNPQVQYSPGTIPIPGTIPLPSEGLLTWTYLLTCTLGISENISSKAHKHIHHGHHDQNPSFPFGRICFVALVMREGGESS